MESYQRLIDKELEFSTPKGQYEYLLDLKEKEIEHAKMIGTLRICLTHFKALSETPGLENVKAICDSMVQILTPYKK